MWLSLIYVGECCKVAIAYRQVSFYLLRRHFINEEYNKYKLKILLNALGDLIFC